MTYCKTLVALGKIGRTVQKRVRFGKNGHTVKNESYLEKTVYTVKNGKILGFHVTSEKTKIKLRLKHFNFFPLSGKRHF